MKQKSKAQLSTGVFILMVLGILVLVNVVSARLFGRLDLTENEMYSLSDASKGLMKHLDDQVFAKAYFTSDLPAPYNSHARFVKDLFEEYAAYSKGNFRFEFIDPGEDEEIKQKMMILGIPPVQIQEIQNDKFQVKQAFLGIVFYYADKKEIIPIVKNITSLEYDITSTIRKLTSDKLRVIGFLQGHDEPNPREEMKNALSQIEKNYKVQMVNLSGDNMKIADEIDTLVIVNPKKEFEEEALFNIDQFLMKGKTVAFFTDAVDVDIQSFRGTPLNTGLEKLQKHYGISVNPDLVLDLQNKRINVASQQGAFRITNIVNYPLIPVITDLDDDNTLTSKMDALPFSFISSLEIASDSDKIKYSVLARTTPRSWNQTGAFQLNPMQNLSPGATSKTGPFPVIAMAQGKFSSYFANQAEQSNSDKPWLADPAAIRTESPDTRILVIGDGTFTLDNFSDPSNTVFFADAMDWLIQDESLISIRGRGVMDKPIAELEPWEKTTIKYMNMIGVPLLMLLFGLLRWSMRRARRKGFQLASD